jgi:hypothetical protein
MSQNSRIAWRRPNRPCRNRFDLLDMATEMPVLSVHYMEFPKTGQGGAYLSVIRSPYIPPLDLVR